MFGASPRAPIHLIEGARALAFLRGRDYVLPEDVTDLVPDVLRHRLVLSYEALADGAVARRADPSAIMQQVAGAREAAGDACPKSIGQARELACDCLRPTLKRLGVDRASAASTACCTATTARCSAGFGLDLADLREYQYHDDVRHIDWNVTARHADPVRARVSTRSARSPRGSCWT